MQYFVNWWGSGLYGEVPTYDKTMYCFIFNVLCKIKGLKLMLLTHLTFAKTLNFQSANILTKVNLTFVTKLTSPKKY